MLEEKPFNDDLRKVAVKRLQYIKYIEKNIRGGWTKKNIEPLLEEIRKSVSEPVPSWRTLVYWRERYLSAEGGIGSLIPKFHHRGRREDRTSHEELECFNRSVDEKFLRLERLSVIKCYRYYLSLVAKLNCTLESSAQIGPVSLSAYYARIKKLPQYDVVAARFGKQFADKQFRVVGSHVPLTRVMERVEMDHTKLDVFLIDDSLDVILGRPYLTAMIDSYSGCIVGIYLSFSPPSYLSVSSCLFNALRNKESVLSNYEEVEGEWPCEGKIETLVVDNGKEFWSKNMEFACASLSTEVQYNPVRQPWLKPKVERIFKTINSDFVHTVPGTCFSNVAEKKEYNPEKHAVMRFSDFMEALHIWIVDIYHCSPGLKCSFPPIYRWMESVKDRPIKKYEKSEEKNLKLSSG
ncbi:hypothetical protein [Modicisalibacter luteus]|uniref:hypothetical protein n=1 Tax=Modicisalibacter luteus TaxID=453962 RepID=UPI003630A901